MSKLPIPLRRCCLWLACAAGFALLTPRVGAQDAAPAITAQSVVELDKALESTKESTSEARQRLAVRRVIRDAEQMLAAHSNDSGRFFVLEFLFRARQQLIALDKDVKHRQDLLETCRELVKAPDDLAGLRLEADLLLSQAELAKQGANAEQRANALRPFVERYLSTPVGAKVLRLAMVMALELGDNRLVTDLREMMESHFATDLEMISFQRDKLGGQVFGAPFFGSFERSDGKLVRFPMDLLGRSTMLLFWSQEDEDMAMLKGIAAAALEKKDELAGRLEIISFNLDGLPDAGESIIRSMGVDWQVLRLPGGKENPIYHAFVRSEPLNLRVSPTGQTALVMTGTSRKKVHSDGSVDYARMFHSALAREWTQPRYVAQLSSLMAGDFLVLDPDGGMDPVQPPELKAVAMGGVVDALARDGTFVPGETLRAIQNCFVASPIRYRLSHAEVSANYTKAAELCRQAIAAHSNAPDLWVVRNRLMVALLGLWKTDADLSHLEAAIAEAKLALAAGYPKGCDIIARFCIAREALRDPAAKPRQVIETLVADCGGENAPGPAPAVAALLALDVADRGSFEVYRDLILKDHTEYPMMWTFSAFLLDRYHDYWLFQVPFTAGWSYGRRSDYFLTIGTPEDAHRLLQTELRTIDGKPMRIPEDLDSTWTAIVFAQPGPWNRKRDDGLPPSPERLLMSLSEVAASRPEGDLKVMLATFGGDAEAIRAGLDPKKVNCPILNVPGGIDNPLIHRLGILSEDNEFNSVLIRKDGRIAVVVSGLAKQRGRSGDTLANVIEHEDEKAIIAALDRGEVEAAKQRILSLAPVFDPDAVDDRGRKLKLPKYSLAHLRARARVYMALGEWEKARADAEEVVQRQLGTDGGMSLRTDELDESEALRGLILGHIQAAKD